MAGESPSLKQEDIEELLRQAQMASGLVPEGSAASAAPAAPPPSGVETNAEEAAPIQAATATMDLPRSTYAPRPSAGQNVGDDVQFLLSQAEQAIASVAQPVEAGLSGLAPFELKDLSGAPASGE